MNVLYLFPYLPTPPVSGGALRVYHILKHLVRHHNVTVAGYSENGDLQHFKKAFPELKDKMHFISRNYRVKNKHRRLLQFYSQFTSHSYWYHWAKSVPFEQELNDLLESRNFDIVQAEFASMGHFDLKTDAIRILDAHNVEYDNFQRMSSLDWSWIRKKFYKREFEKSYREEIRAFKKQDGIMVTSERDGAIIAKDVPEVPRFVVPNGVDTEYFTSNGEEPEPYSIVFTGAMKYVPNYDGMIYFLDEIFPLIQKQQPEAKVYIVGSKPPPVLQERRSRSVIVTGFVEDVRPYIDRASVFVVPLNMGSGTRLKVVEALSMKKPVVSTSIGCEGIEVDDREHLLIRDKPEAFAEAVLQLFKDETLRRKLISNGYDLVQSTYDWHVIGESIDRAYQKLTQEHFKRTPA